MAQIPEAAFLPDLVYGIDPIEVLRSRWNGVEIIGAFGHSISQIRTPESIRMRKIVRRNRARITGKYPSWKAGRMLQWESRSELVCMRTLDWESDVQGIAEQPLGIHYVGSDGDKHMHVPDLLVYRSGILEIYEIKSSEYQADEEFLSRSSLIQNAMQRIGVRYIVYTTKSYRSDPVERFKLNLLNMGRRPVSLNEFENVRRIVRHTSVITWNGICNGMLGSFGREIISRLTLMGFLRMNCIDLSKRNVEFIPERGAWI